MKSNNTNNSQNVIDVKPATGPLALCRKVTVQIHKARNAILSEFWNELEEHQHLLRLALNEAEAIAWQTEFPHLFFPELAAEKVQAVVTWREKQHFVQQEHQRLAIAA
jgi:hypothetical protein